jgi:hypothetical protein
MPACFAAAVVAEISDLVAERLPEMAAGHCCRSYGQRSLLLLSDCQSLALQHHLPACGPYCCCFVQSLCGPSKLCWAARPLLLWLCTCCAMRTALVQCSTEDAVLGPQLAGPESEGESCYLSRAV